MDRKTVLTIVVVVGVALIVVGASALAFPEWLRGAPGGLLALLGAAFLAVAALGGLLKDWRELLFPEKKEEKAEPPKPKPAPAPSRTQEMTGSEEGEQTMRGKGGPQKQKMTGSPRGKQKME